MQRTATQHRFITGQHKIIVAALSELSMTLSDTMQIFKSDTKEL